MDMRAEVLWSVWIEVARYPGRKFYQRSVTQITQRHSSAFPAFINFIISQDGWTRSTADGSNNFAEPLFHCLCDFGSHGLTL
jgi:hypothetical protein